MREVREITLQVRHVDLAARHWPGRSTPRILALHGWLDNAESFTPLAALLPDVELVALEFPGHGHSAHRPPGELLHFIDYIADVHAVLEELGWSRCVLMGHSLGAGVASIYASAFAQRINGLICLDGLGPVSCAPASLPGRLHDSLCQYLGNPATPKTVYDEVDAAVRHRRQAGDMSWAAAARLVRRNLKPSEGGYIWRCDARLRRSSPYYLSEPQVMAYLRAIAAPTLMIRANDSLPRFETLFKQRARAISNMTWHQLSGGHHLHMDKPECVAPLIQKFLHTLPAA